MTCNIGIFTTDIYLNSDSYRHAEQIVLFKLEKTQGKGSYCKVEVLYE